jgi:hypothetical protein
MSIESSYLSIVTKNVIKDQEISGLNKLTGAEGLEDPSRKQFIEESLIKSHLERPTRFSLDLGEIGTLHPIDKAKGHWVRNIEYRGIMGHLVRGEVTDDSGNDITSKITAERVLSLLGVVYEDMPGIWHRKNQEAQKARVQLYFLSHTMLDLLNPNTKYTKRRS